MTVYDLEKLRLKYEAALEMLRRLEWIGEGTFDFECPMCFRRKDAGYHRRCELAQLLTDETTSHDRPQSAVELAP